MPVFRFLIGRGLAMYLLVYTCDLLHDISIGIIILCWHKLNFIRNK